MQTPRFAAVAIIATAVLSCGPRAVSVSATTTTPASTRTISPAQGETRFGIVRQLTYGGENAEAYFSPDGEWLIFQSTRNGRTCDQQYVMRSDGSALRRVSDGTGKTT